MVTRRKTFVIRDQVRGCNRHYPAVEDSLRKFEYEVCTTQGPGREAIGRSVDDLDPDNGMAGWETGWDRTRRRDVRDGPAAHE